MNDRVTAQGGVISVYALLMMAVGLSSFGWKAVIIGVTATALTLSLAVLLLPTDG